MELPFSRLSVHRSAVIAVVVLWVVVGQGMAQPQVMPQATNPSNESITVKLGGLMLSPIQRQNLEYVRSTGRSLAGAEQNADQLLDPAAGLSKTLTISGVVIRTGNRSTVWVNDQPLYGQGSESALRMQARRVGVSQPRTETSRVLNKTGKGADTKTQEEIDLLPPGSIKIIPPKTSTTAKDRQEK
jgi:hypothetical protein